MRLKWTWRSLNLDWFPQFDTWAHHTVNAAIWYYNSAKYGKILEIKLIWIVWFGVGAWRGKVHFVFCGKYEVNYRKKCPTRQDNGTLMNVYWRVIVQGSQKKCIREDWGQMRIIASGLYLCQKWSDVCMLISRNIYVSLQLLVQNRTRKWHFPLNFRTLHTLNSSLRDRLFRWFKFTLNHLIA